MLMFKPDQSPDDKFELDVHKESHARMRSDERLFSQLSPIDKLTRVAMESTIELPDVAQGIREELTVFQSELDIHGLADS